ncbi:hypothetical protein BDZ94DRAFT_1213575 [Collybia nuda]|uniref:RanBD1 domain-containing protein n=1 Tax=Collybia nuda TaxID=64659 RepID=A0A9P5YC63_9AGAR|nr:hypothetical protein BDZ94DRAFT_1213575 [Collybia nuda]
MPDPNSEVGRETQHESSPPSSPSSPDPTEVLTDTKLSRKREREVSLEPATTPKAALDVDPLSKEARTPAKKNRRQLDTTQEEEDVTPRSRSNSGSPPSSVSPPQEMKMKVRQISQGVEDLSWRNMKAVTPERNIEVDPKNSPSTIRGNENGSLSSDVITEAPGDEHPTTPDNLEVCEPDSGDKGLKRKFLERGTSQGPPEVNNTSQASTEAVKRPRDDPDKDDNPRETKRPSPPPEPKSPKRKLSSASSPKLTGFMAYASTSSPFAAVKGRNIFSSNKSSPSPPVSATPTPAISSLNIPSLGESSSLPPPTTMKRSGFEAFSSPTSPFLAATRSKSPVLGSTSRLGRNKSPPRRGNPANSNAFSSYAGPIQSFAIPVQKRARAGSPSSSSRSSLERNSTISVFGSNGAATDSGTEEDQNASFGAKLRAGRDDEDEGKSDDEQRKPILTEQDLMTGEEEEQTIHQVRGKLFSLSDGNQWKERGTGTLKLNVRRSDGSGARLVMRKEAVYTLLLNVTLFHGMRCTLAQDPRYLRFSVIEDGATTHYNLRLASAKIAQELLEEINANIPTL